MYLVWVHKSSSHSLGPEEKKLDSKWNELKRCRTVPPTNETKLHSVCTSNNLGAKSSNKLKIKSSQSRVLLTPSSGWHPHSSISIHEVATENTKYLQLSPNYYFSAMSRFRFCENFVVLLWLNVARSFRKWTMHTTNIVMHKVPYATKEATNCENFPSNNAERTNTIPKMNRTLFYVFYASALCTRSKLEAVIQK